MAEMEIFGKEQAVGHLRVELGCTAKDAKVIYDVVVDMIKGAADSGMDVKLGTMGKLRRVVIPAGAARNPQTGEEVQVGERVKYALKSRPRALEAEVEGEADPAAE